MSDDLDALPYVPLEVYNGTSMPGGDSLTEDLNVYYNAGDIAWMITATALVLLMIPGVGYDMAPPIFHIRRLTVPVSSTLALPDASLPSLSSGFRWQPPL